MDLQVGLLTLYRVRVRSFDGALTVCFFCVCYLTPYAISVYPALCDFGLGVGYVGILMRCRDM